MNKSSNKRYNKKKMSINSTQKITTVTPNAMSFHVKYKLSSQPWTDARWIAHCHLLVLVQTISASSFVNNVHTEKLHTSFEVVAMLLLRHRYCWYHSESCFSFV